MITRVTGKNRVTVPAELARKEDMRPGTRLEWRTADQPARSGEQVSRRHPGSAVDRRVEQRTEEATSRKRG